MAGQPGPVAVLFGHDALAGSVAPDSQPVLYPTRDYLPPAPPPADPAQIDAAAGRILAAERPVIVAGNGVRIAQARDELRELAELLDAPVFEVAADHGAAISSHRQFNKALLQALDAVQSAERAVAA
jgi:acetolactate synthase-1/2/3 large subunit